MIDGRLCIIDIKTGSKQKAYSCQTGAYALAYNEMTGEKIKDRYCVYLDENEYRLEHHTEKLDEMIFLSALSVYQYKYKRRP
jgi:CRISPR/Cas system-associated exonuclease Cas4 (RecB family)